MLKLDYCNAVGLLSGVPQSTLERRQRVQNAAARLVHQLDVRDHVTPSLMVLHWLPIRCRIDKICAGSCTEYTLADAWRISKTSPYVQQRSNTYWPAIGFQQQVRDATAASQVWRTHLLVCWTCCMELTATRHSCCTSFLNCHVQETTQNALFNIVFSSCQFLARRLLLLHPN